jgi:hypothetical protein
MASSQGSGIYWSEKRLKQILFEALLSFPQSKFQKISESIRIIALNRQRVPGRPLKLFALYSQALHLEFTGSVSSKTTVYGLAQHVKRGLNELGHRVPSDDKSIRTFCKFFLIMNRQTANSYTKKEWLWLKKYAPVSTRHQIIKMLTDNLKAIEGEIFKLRMMKENDVNVLLYPSVKALKSYFYSERNYARSLLSLFTSSK